MIDGWDSSCKIALWWMSLDHTYDNSTLIQVMAWCRQATCTSLPEAMLTKFLYIKAQTKRSTFCKRHLQMHFFKLHMSRVLYITGITEIQWLNSYRESPVDNQANTQRNKHVIITSKRCFDVLISCLLRVFAGNQSSSSLFRWKFVAHRRQAIT